jgi:hypothetical protein
LPAPHNAPGFVSFAQYLDANQGSLAQERDQLLAGARAEGAQADAAGQVAEQGAFGAGRDAALAAGPHGAGGFYNYASDNPGFDPTTAPGYADFLTQRGEAADAAQSLTDPYRAGDKYSPFESGLLGADVGYRGQAGELQKQYGGALDGYLSGLSDQFVRGYSQNSQAGARPERPAETSGSGSGSSAGYDDAGPREPQVGSAPGSFDDAGNWVPDQAPVDPYTDTFSGSGG